MISCSWISRSPSIAMTAPVLTSPSPAMAHTPMATLFFSPGA